MPMYEHVFLARQDLAQGQVDALSESWTKIIEENGGKVAKTEYWGLRTIAYRIQKNRKAHYVLLGIDAPAPALAELERQVTLSEDVLRFLTIRVDALDPEPSAMMRRDRDREGGSRDRDGRGGGGRGGERGPPRFERSDRRDGGGGFGDRPPREGGFDRGDRAREERSPQPVVA